MPARVPRKALPVCAGFSAMLESSLNRWPKLRFSAEVGDSRYSRPAVSQVRLASGMRGLRVGPLEFAFRPLGR